MKRSLLVAAAAAALVLAYLSMRGAPPDADSSVNPLPAADAPALDAPGRDVAAGSAQERPPTRERPETEAALRQRVADLEGALELANELVMEAEAALAASERDVEELEALVAEIRARGENPADYAELAVERFQPAFFRFQDAAAAYDNAVAVREEAEKALAQARTALNAGNGSRGGR